jgi:hypothetical protein
VFDSLEISAKSLRVLHGVAFYAHFLAEIEHVIDVALSW